MSDSTHYISFKYETVNGRVWTGNIELINGDVQEAVNSILLAWHNVTPNKRIEGDVEALIYSDPFKLFLIDTLTWTKISKDNFKYITGERDE